MEKSRWVLRMKSFGGDSGKSFRGKSSEGCGKSTDEDWAFVAVFARKSFSRVEIIVKKGNVFKSRTE